MMETSKAPHEASSSPAPEDVFVKGDVVGVAEIVSTPLAEEVLTPTETMREHNLRGREAQLAGKTALADWHFDAAHKAGQEISIEAAERRGRIGRALYHLLGV